MKRNILLIFALFLSGFSGVIQSLNACDSETLPETYLHFIENKGQWPDQVDFQVELKGARVFLEHDQLTYVLMDMEDVDLLHEKHHNPSLDYDPIIDAHAFRVHFLNALSATEIEGSCMMEAYRNYYIGNDPSKWASNVGQFRQVDYNQLYNGIDLRFYGVDGVAKYDLMVAPGADINQIQFEYEGVDNLFIEDGMLNAVTSVNTLIENRPLAYQYIDGQYSVVPCEFVLSSDQKLSFEFPEGYDQSVELVIDPEIIFSTYTGSTADNWGFTATYDNDGFMYSGGAAFGIGYPTTTGAYQMNFAGGTGTLTTDIGITKYNLDGTDLVYSTYVGGAAANEIPHSLVVDANGDLIIYGTSGSNDYPTTEEAFDQSFNGGTSVTINSISFPNGSDIIVSRLNSDGNALVASTYIGGIGNDGLNTAGSLLHNYADQARGEVFITEENDIIIASCTQSIDFPATLDSYQPFSAGGQDGCVLKFNSDLSDLIWGTHLGGSGDDAVYSVKPGPNGTILACGGTRSENFPTTAGALIETAPGGTVDAFVTKIAEDGESLEASTFLGTPNYDQSYFVDLDAEGNVYTVGQTAGTYEIVGDVYSNPGSGQFIHKLTGDLSTTLFSTVFGNGNGNPNLTPTAFLVDKCDQVYVSGWGGTTNGIASGSTTSGMPVSDDAYQSTTDGSDFYFAVFAQGCTDLTYATFFGAASGTGEHVDGGTSRFDKEGVIYQAVCAGCGGSSLFPTTPGAWSNTNNSSNCNLGSIKFNIDLAPTIADFVTFSEIEVCLSNVIEFENTSTNAEEFFWDFGDGNTSDEENPTHTFEEPGLYEVILTASKPGTCNGSDVAIKLVTVFAEPSISLLEDPICLNDGTENTMFSIVVDGVDDTFTLSGDIEGTALLGEPFEFVTLGDGSTISIVATGDVSGCFVPLTIELPVCPECDVTAPTVSLESDPFCLNDGTDNGQFSFSVTGAGEFFDLSGDYVGLAQDGASIEVVIPMDGSEFNMIATDEFGCETPFVLGLPNCPDCMPDPGSMPAEQQVVCADGTVSATTSGEVLEEGQQLYYAVHTSSTASPGTVLALNATGTFSYSDLNDADYYTTYYISPIVSFPDADGGPILDDNCTVVAAGTPFVFLAPIGIEIDEYCDWLTGVYYMVIYPTGGFPGYDSSVPYLVTGDFAGEVIAGNSVEVTFEEGVTDQYFFETSSPGFDCGIASKGEMFVCYKTPIELVQFEAEANSNGTLLNWITASESENDFFTVQWSLDGSSFEDLAKLDGAGTTGIENKYEYFHSQNECGTLYYRLSWTSFSGLVEYSQVISVKQASTSNDNGISVWPNPSTVNNDFVQIELLSSLNAELSVFDIKGRLVQQIKSEGNDCLQTIAVPSSNLAPGIYFIQATTKKQKWTEKLIVR